MSTNDIQHKVRQLLAGNPISTEAETIYLLVECRKLLEHDQSLKDSSPTLEFYLNWGLHTELSRSGARIFLANVSPILTLAGFDQKQHDMVNALLTLDAFRIELRTLLSSFDADLSICDHAARWTSFLQLYSQVVQDAQLTLEAPQPPSGLMQLAVKKVTIRPVDAAAPPDSKTKVFPMTWLIEYSDGRTGRLELSRYGLLGAQVHLFGTTLEAVSAVHRMQNRVQSN